MPILKLFSKRPVMLAALLIALFGFVAYRPQAIQISQLSSVNAAAIDYYLKLEGIEGESQDERHRGEIKLLSFSWGEDEPGIEQLMAMSRGAGGGAGKVQFQDFHFATYINKASPKLMEAVATGKLIPEVVLTARKAGEKQPVFLEIKLTEVYITSYQTGGSSIDLPTDQVSFNFAKIEVKYWPQNEDGSLGAAVEFNWDLKANKTF